MFQLNRNADSGVVYPSDQEPVAHSQKCRQYPPEIVNISQFVGYVGQILGIVQAEISKSKFKVSLSEETVDIENGGCMHQYMSLNYKHQGHVTSYPHLL